MAARKSQEMAQAEGLLRQGYSAYAVAKKTGLAQSSISRSVICQQIIAERTGLPLEVMPPDPIEEPPTPTSRRRNVYLDDATWDAANVLGGGNASEGIRMAVQYLHNMGRCSQMAAMKIPDGVRIADLQYVRESDGDVSFDVGIVQRILAFNNMPINEFDAEEISLFVFMWYRTHRAAGGELDPVMEDILAEAAAEDQAGQHFSYQPGVA